MLHLSELRTILKFQHKKKFRETSQNVCVYQLYQKYLNLLKMGRYNWNLEERFKLQTQKFIMSVTVPRPLLLRDKEQGSRVGGEPPQDVTVTGDGRKPPSRDQGLILTA